MLFLLLARLFAEVQRAVVAEIEVKGESKGAPRGAASFQVRFRSDDTVGYLSFGPIEKIFMFSVTLACARRTGAAACVERRRRER